jgi:hypothetical protein
MNICLMMIQLDRNMICLFRICCDDGCIIIIYSNTQQNANSKDNESETYECTRNEWKIATQHYLRSDTDINETASKHIKINLCAFKYDTCVSTKTRKHLKANINRKCRYVLDLISH